MIVGTIRMMLLSLMIFAVVISGCEEKPLTLPLTMFWGIDEEVRGFEGLEREPEGLEVEILDENTLSVLWRVGESYILPICAKADRELDGVRYLGSGIPESLEVEWLEPHSREWYDLDEIPDHMIRVDIMEEDNFYSIDFGPPEGAEFREDMFRVIWFRVTPTEEGIIGFDIYGYLSEEDPPSRDPVSNILSLQAEVVN